MIAVGETLRRERLRKGLGLEQISRATKINAHLLDAIENDRFELLPSGMFARSFVRQYARFLDLDEQELAAAVEQTIGPVADLPSSPATSPERAFRVPRMVEWEGSGRSNSSVLPALFLVVAVMLVCSAVYAWWQRIHRPTPPAQHTEAAQSANMAPPPQTDAAPSAAAPANTDPAAPLQVSMTADDDAWVQAWADGKSVTEGILPPNEVKTVSAESAIRIRTGNAGSLQLTVNGKPAGPLGPKGQIRIVEVTRDGVQILPPPPKPAAPAPEPL